MTQIEIAKQFSAVPAGRFRKDGPFSGELFRDEFLLKALTADADQVEVVLDGAEGYGSSFLEEAFGGLVRLHKFSPEVLHQRLKVVARSNPYQIYVREIWEYIDTATKGPR